MVTPNTDSFVFRRVDSLADAKRRSNDLFERFYLIGGNVSSDVRASGISLFVITALDAHDVSSVCSQFRAESSIVRARASASERRAPTASRNDTWSVDTLD